MPKLPYRTLTIAALFSTLAATLSACSAGYITRAAWEQAKILRRRVPLQEVIDRPDLAPDTRAKLQLALEVRAFSSTIGLSTDGNFSTYSYSDRNPLVWVVMASHRDAFKLYGWWFPIVGTVPYKGFFERADAERQAQQLEAEGYETWVRGASAFSTLGWFNDPLLASMLKYPSVDLANTILHEITHSTLWIKGSVPFNETLANFVGHQAALEFFRAKKAAATTSADIELTEQQVALAQQQLFNERQLAQGLQALVEELTQLYASTQSSEQKLRQREVVFNEQRAKLKALLPGLRGLSSVNNAEIMQLHIYRTKYAEFQHCFDASGATLPGFLERMKELAQRVEAEDTEPYQELARCGGGQGGDS